MMVDTNELRGIIAKNGKTQTDVARMLNITPKTFYSKKNYLLNFLLISMILAKESGLFIISGSKVSIAVISGVFAFACVSLSTSIEIVEESDVVNF